MTTIKDVLKFILEASPKDLDSIISVYSVAVSAPPMPALLKDPESADVAGEIAESVNPARGGLSLPSGKFVGKKYVVDGVPHEMRVERVEGVVRLAREDFYKPQSKAMKAIWKLLQARARGRGGDTNPLTTVEIATYAYGTKTNDASINSVGIQLRKVSAKKGSPLCRRKQGRTFVWWLT